MIDKYSHLLLVVEIDRHYKQNEHVEDYLLEVAILVSYD